MRLKSPAAVVVAAGPPTRSETTSTAEAVVDVRGRLGPENGGWRPFTLELRIQPGWHLNANPPLLRFLVATEVKASGTALRGVRYPNVERFEGTVTIAGEVEAPSRGPVALSLTYQPCDEERCLTPVTREVEMR